MEFAQCRERHNQAKKKEMKVRRRGRRELNGLSCSINYDKVKEPEAGGMHLVRMGGKTRGLFLVLNEGSIVKCSRIGGSFSKIGGERVFKNS